LFRIRAFRRFAWAKGILALFLAAGVAYFVPSPEGTFFGFFDRFSALVLAFSLPLLPQISGPDREYLRLSLDLRVLNAITLFQRAIYRLLLAVLVGLYPRSLPAIAACGILTTVLISW